MSKHKVPAFDPGQFLKGPVQPVPAAPEPVEPQLVPGRSCGTCTLCCKVYEVPAVESPMGKWCQHCKPGSGCGIHETRPNHCREFFCLWMIAGWLGDEWKPERAKFVLTVDPRTRFLFAQVDTGSPQSWRQEPYYGQFKRWAREGLATRRHVVVFHNKLATLILPNQDIQIGELGPHDRILIAERIGQPGYYEVERRTLS